MSTNTERPTYDLSDVLDLSPLESVDGGTSILVSGPAMTGKQDVIVDILADGVRRGEGGLAVTTGDDAAAIATDVADRAPECDRHHISAIDCRADGNRSQRTTESGTSLHHVGSPGDLTGIGIGITESLDRFDAEGLDRGRIGLVSLSTMLTYTDKQTVFKFCHVVSSRLDSAEYLGAFAIDSSAHDPQTLQVVKQAFDGMVEIREQDGIREARVLGVEPDPSDWIEL